MPICNAYETMPVVVVLTLSQELISKVVVQSVVVEQIRDCTAWRMSVHVGHLDYVSQQYYTIQKTCTTFGNSLLYSFYLSLEKKIGYSRP